MMSMSCRYPASFAIVLGLLITACSAGTPQAEVAVVEEQIIYPTHTPNPTYTSYPTYSPTKIPIEMTSTATFEAALMPTATSYPTGSPTMVPTTMAPTATFVPVLRTTGTATATVTLTSPITSQSLEISSSGLASDLEALADRPLEQFITASQIDVGRVTDVSRLRSRMGHDYTDSFNTCSSMKHYFNTANHPDLSTPIYSPVDGVLVWRTKGSGDQDGVWLEQAGINAQEIGFLDERLYIRPDAAPNVWIKFHHVSPVTEIVQAVPVAVDVEVVMGQVDAPQPGFRVSAGQLIAHGLAEISVEQHLSGSGRPSPCVTGVTRDQYGKLGSYGPCGDVLRFRSIFSLMTDEVFALYQGRGATSRDDFIISAEERAARPPQCEGQFFVDEADVNDPDEVVQLTP